MFTIPATADDISAHKKATDIQVKDYVNALLTKHIFCKYFHSHLVQLVWLFIDSIVLLNRMALLYFILLNQIQ